MIAEGTIDLHVHTTASDGTLTPAELIRYAWEKGLRAVAITDHDTVAGIPEARQAGAELGVEVISGVEISTDYQGQEMHILGYCLEENAPELGRALEQLQSFRRERNPRMAAKLRSLGMEITLEEVEALAKGQVVGRTHFAALMVQKGYAQSTEEAFDSYLASGRPGYVKKEKLTPREGIRLVTQAGGIPVLAHPQYLREQGRDSLGLLLQELKGYGLQGIEVFYSNHTPEATRLYGELAQEQGLLLTGGSDFHGANKPEIDLGRGRGDLAIPYRLLAAIKGRKGDRGPIDGE